MVVVFFFTMYIFRFHSRLALEVHTNGTENFGCFSLRAPFLSCAHLFPSACYVGYGCFGKSRKKVSIPRKVLPFSEKFPSDWTIEFEFFPELPGFPCWNDKCSFPDGISSKPRSARLVIHLLKHTFYTIFRLLRPSFGKRNSYWFNLCKWWTQFRNEI